MAKQKKAYGPHDRILIEHKDTHEQYGVAGATFDKGWADKGWKAISFEDGRAFDSAEPEESVEPAATPLEPVPEATAEEAGTPAEPEE